MTALPERFTLTIQGDTRRVRSRECAHPQLAYYLTQLLIGQKIPDATWASWGLQVQFEPDMDQGEE